MAEPPPRADDPFDGLVLDDDFVRGGQHEPSHRTRDAIATYGDTDSSWRHPRNPGVSSLSDARRRRNRRVDRRARIAAGTPVSPLFLLLVAALGGSLYAAWSTTSKYAVFGAVVAGWLVSLCLHEFAHAAVAHAGGDESVATRGYLRLDIRRYAHPLLSFALPVFYVLIGGIGLPGGAVWIDKGALRTRRMRSLTSLAGPAANVVCAALCLVPLAFVSDFDSHQTFWAALAFLGFLQVSAVIINLLPVPGLDGWGVIEPYLPAEVAALGRRIGFVGALVLFFVLFRFAAVSGPLGRAMIRVVTLSGAPDYLVAVGYALFRFWSGW